MLLKYLMFKIIPSDRELIILILKYEYINDGVYRHAIYFLINIYTLHSSAKSLAHYADA